DQGGRNNPLHDVPYWWDRLIDRVLNVPQFRRMYCLRLLELLDTTFSDTERVSRVEAGHYSIRYDGERDAKKPGWLENDIWFYPSLSWIRDFSTQRNEFLRTSIPDFIPPPSVNLFINEISPEDWIEIYNWSPKEPVNLRGLYLSDDATEPTKIPLPDQDLPPGGFFVMKASEVKYGGGFIGLFERGDGGDVRAVDQITYPALGGNLEDRVTYGRITDGSGELDVLPNPTHGKANRWRAPVVIDASSKAGFAPRRLVKGDRLESIVYLRNRMNGPQTVQLWSKLSAAGEPAYPGAFSRPQEIKLQPLEIFKYELSRALPANLHAGVSYDFVVEIGIIQEGNERVWDGLQTQLSLFSSDFVGQLYINELMAANRQTIADEYGEYDDWVELYNSSDTTIRLDGLYLSDDIREPTKWEIRGVEIASKGYELFWLDGDRAQGVRHAGFNLSASGEGIGIFDTDENENAIIDWIAFGVQAEDVSLGRYPDGSAKIGTCATATPGESNIRIEDSVTFNELMVDNRSTLADEAGEYDPWIEIYNSGCHVVNLGGLYLSDTASVPTRWILPSVDVPPGGFRIIWADGQVNQGVLHTNFSLSSDGGSIFLFDRDVNFNAPLDSFRFGQQTADVSLGRHPNGDGQWDTLRTPTPGAINIRPQLYINEIMARNRSTIADESGQFDDWIELYNATDKPIRLDGLFLSDDPGDPTKWRLPAVTISAGGFVLIWADRDEDAGKLHANFSLSTNPETVGLYEASNAGVKRIDSLEFPLMDMDVSYGRIPDGGFALEMFNTATPGSPNVSDSETPAGPIRLMQNYPNPHTTDTLIPFRLSTPSELALMIYNHRGQKVRHIDLGFRETGSYVDFQRAVRWDGQNEQGELVASGVYFYTLASENYRATRKLKVLR
ncbi:MAG: lamin tail domain-containing protein, partial [Candidatus Poribacteria bacterium]|nr:lamin tail domain-containing protein [Candidatus Poribacteria bacterium]